MERYASNMHAVDVCISELEDWLRRALQNVEGGGAAGETTVVRAPAGYGKSTTLRRLLAETMSPGALERVLWVVREVNASSARGKANAGKEPAPDSLAWEAFKDFTSRSGKRRPKKDWKFYPPEQGKREKERVDRYMLTVRVLNRRSLGDQELFFWQDGFPEIKIVSHARLPRIFGLHPSKENAQLRKAQLIVIDEDPVASMILEGFMPLMDVNPEFGRVYKALQEVARSRGKVHGRADQQQMEELSGRRFFKLLDEQLQERVPADVLADAFGHLFLTVPLSLQEGIVRTAKGKTPEAEQRRAALTAVSQAFLDDLLEHRDTPERGSLRFSIVRPLLGQRGGAVHYGPPQLRFTLLAPMELRSKFIVLDAYAEAKMYDRVFPSVRLLNFTGGRKLRIEVSSALRLDPPSVSQKVKDPRSRALQVLEEVHDLAQARQPDENKRRTLLVLTKAAATRLKQQGLGPGTLPFITDLYWFKGRGLNAYAGANVFAPSLPYLNRAYRDHTLSALFRHDTDLMKAMTAHAQAAELLQTLHRSRQTVTAGGAQPPFILVGAFHQALDKASARTPDPSHPASSGKTLEEFLAPLANEVEIVRYEPVQRIEVGHRHGRWLTAVSLIARELLTLLPDGLPQAALQALPLVKDRRDQTQDAELFAAFLHQLATHPDLPASWTRSNLVRHLRRDPTWRYSNLEAAGNASNRNLLSEAVGGPCLQLTKHQVQRDPRTRRPRGARPAVYVSSAVGHERREVTAQKVMKRFETLQWLTSAPDPDPCEWDQFIQSLPALDVPSPHHAIDIRPQAEQGKKPAKRVTAPGPS